MVGRWPSNSVYYILLMKVIFKFISFPLTTSKVIEIGTVLYGLRNLLYFGPSLPFLFQIPISVLFVFLFFNLLNVLLSRILLTGILLLILIYLVFVRQIILYNLFFACILFSHF